MQGNSGLPGVQGAPGPKGDEVRMVFGFFVERKYSNSDFTLFIGKEINKYSNVHKVCAKQK